MKIVFGFLILALFFGIVGFVGIKTLQEKIDSVLSFKPDQQFIQLTPTPTSPMAKRINETLFVPYWSINSSFEEPSYNTLIYFGVSVGEHGLTTTDDGYYKLATFSRFTSTQKKILAVRMVDNTTNFSVLKNEKAKMAVIHQSIDLAKKYHFQGILLNIEVSALPFASLVDQITLFNTQFATAVHKAGLEYTITAYGDTFYRVRPFDIEKIARDVDFIYIMAYDFHKAKGNPGPNFPLSGRNTYGYDYSRMIQSFADAVALQKLVVVFGLYGYDWQVDENNVPQGEGTPRSLREIKAEIIDSCQYLSCEWERDVESAEIKAIYQDSQTRRHIVWFEDEESIKRKQAFLKKRGIGSFAYWAYSYF